MGYDPDYTPTIVYGVAAPALKCCVYILKKGQKPIQSKRYIAKGAAMFIYIFFATFSLKLVFIGAGNIINEHERIIKLETASNSTTGCSLTTTHGSTIFCEYAEFGSFPRQNLTAPIIYIGANGLGCDLIKDSYTLMNRIVWINRGGCPFTTKVMLAQDAGAAAVIILDDKDDTSPVRMKAMGNEKDTIFIPAVMIPNRYASIVERITSEETSIKLLLSTTYVSKSIEEEIMLKRAVEDKPGDPHSLMQLTSFMVRSGWIETANPYMVLAGDLSSDPEIHYSIGEYFHNIREEPEIAQYYFSRCIIYIMDNIYNSEIKTASNREMNMLVEIASNAPEREEQRLIFSNFLKHKMMSEFASMNEELYNRGTLGTAAVLFWVTELDQIGEPTKLLEMIQGKWRHQHVRGNDEKWQAAMDEAEIVVKRFMDQDEN